ncbi:hypothetical protein [Cytobacillus praedii]|uniref:hypothetical protein n=2 Tax=Cytobacillus praedii TaxID=1742358 RepID=UPI002E1BA8CF|nr:hypothetical protein [Cytobacillus praedii]
MFRSKILVLLSLCILLIGGYVLIRSDILKIEEDRGIIKNDGRIYSNATALEWFEKEKSKFQKGKLLEKLKGIKVNPVFKME